MKKIENHLRTNSPINHIFEFSSEFDGATGWDIDREYPLIETTAGGQGISDNDHEEEERRFLLPPVPITGGARRRVRMEVKMDTPSRELMPDQGSRCTDAFTIHSGVNFFHFGSINVSICNLSAATIAIGILSYIYIYIYIYRYVEYAICNDNQRSGIWDVMSIRRGGRLYLEFVFTYRDCQSM